MFCPFLGTGNDTRSSSLRSSISGKNRHREAKGGKDLIMMMMMMMMMIMMIIIMVVVMVVVMT